MVDKTRGVLFRFKEGEVVQQQIQAPGEDMLSSVVKTNWEQNISHHFRILIMIVLKFTHVVTVLQGELCTG